MVMSDVLKICLHLNTKSITSSVIDQTSLTILKNAALKYVQIYCHALADMWPA